jgi:nitrogen fixation protein FixH
MEIKIKLNYGHGILLLILLFMAGILCLVYKCSKQQVDLVSATYYEQELKFSEQMTKEKNSLQLNKDVKIGYDESKRIVEIDFPALADRKSPNGSITFYKPDNASLDFSKPVFTDQHNKQTIGTSGMVRGYWNVKVNWTAGSTPYYSETKIFIN